MTSALRLPRIRVRFKKPKPPHPFWFLCLLIALYAAFEIVFNVLQWDASSPAYIAQGGLTMAYIWPGLRSPSRPAVGDFRYAVAQLAALVVGLAIGVITGS